MAEDSDLVTLSVTDQVADVRLNRPDKYNALSPAMFKAIVAMGRTLMKREDVRAVVLSGEGPGFCSGLDMQSFQAMASPESKPGTTDILTTPDDEIANSAQSLAYIWKQLPMPVIAALHGVAYGGGLQIALGADIRIAAPSARFSIMEIKWGLIPDMSLTQTIRDLLPLDVVKELVFTGRVFNADEADKLGIVTRVADQPHQAAMALAREIAGKNPSAIRAGKQLLESTRHDTAGNGLALEEKLQLELIGTPNQKEAVMANFEKRAPRFS